MAHTESPSCHISCGSLIDHILSLELCLPFLSIFLKIESPSSHISKSLFLLERQEEKYQSIIHSASLKDHFQSLKLGLLFLEMFFSISNNEDLSLRIKAVLYDVRLELHSLSNKQIDGSLILDLDRAYTNLLEKMKNVMIKTETREYDVIFPKRVHQKGDLKRTHDFVLRILGDLSSCKDDLIAPLSKEIEDMKEKLILVQPLLTYVASTGVSFKHTNELDKKLWIPLETLLDRTACLLYLCLVDKMNEEMALAVKHKLSELLEKTNVKEIYLMALRASIIESTKDSKEHGLYLLRNLVTLLDCNVSSVYLNDPIKKLHDELKSLETVIRMLPYRMRQQKCNYLITPIEAITCKAIPILSSCYDIKMNEDMAREVNDALSEVLEQIKHIQEDARELKLYNYPTTGGLAFLDFFLGHLEELLKHKPKFIGNLMIEVRKLLVGFNILILYLKRIEEQHNEHEELGDLWRRTIGLGYQAEYVLDFYLATPPRQSRPIYISLSKIIEQTKLIKLEAKALYNDKKYHAQAGQDVAKASTRVLSQATDTASYEVVGFEDEAKKIIEYLVGDQRQLDVISIVGMPGLGKTTLAKKIYENPLIMEHFDIRKWCSISQTYRRRELLLTLTGDVSDELTDEKLAEEVYKHLKGRLTGDVSDELTDEKLAEEVYKHLKGRRYLIILDDMWDIMAWNDLKRSFPDDKTSSRILITSRHQNLASQVGSKVHALRPFSDDESWELFQKILCQKESFSQELLDFGKQIARRCNRLPLAIVIIAGLLAKVEKSLRKWKQIAANLRSRIFTESEGYCKAIFELSYNHLSDHMKSCFLYFAAFSEDEEIPVRKLKWLWIAEGFVQNNEARSLEDLADEYLMDLISRSLVIAIKNRSGGGVKTCSVHDLLHDFCLEKAEEESFLQVRRGNDFSEFSGVYDYRRLCIYDGVKDLMRAKLSHWAVRSLLNRSRLYFFTPGTISFILGNFKLLKVLDIYTIEIGTINVDNAFSRIGRLIHLRYLAIQANATSIPSSIANLWNLQFLLVNANGENNNKVTKVPDFLWGMVNLRHVHINHKASFRSRHGNRFEDSASFLHNLETLSTPCLSYGEDAENLLRRLPKLRKLKYNFKADGQSYPTKCHQFPVLEFLDQLKSLKVFFQGILLERTCEFNFPKNLEKLTLSRYSSWREKSYLFWDDISKMGRTLPNLKVLKLLGDSWDDTWIVNSGDFPTLKYLKLSNLRNTREWIASEDSFPILEQLVLKNCNNLDEIPPCFGEISTLQMITVEYCKPSVDASARRIQKEQQEEWQNEELKVYINSSQRA